MESETLVIVDMQNDFLLPNGLLTLGHDTTELRKLVADYIRRFSGVVIFTKDVHEANDIEFKTFPAHCVTDTLGCEIVQELLDATSIRTTFIKAKKSYVNDSIVEQLANPARTKGNIHIVGVCTHICVHDIAAGIVNHAKNVHNHIPSIIIHKNMVDDFNPEMAEFALKRLQNLYGVKVV